MLCPPSLHAGAEVCALEVQCAGKASATMRNRQCCACCWRPWTLLWKMLHMQCGGAKHTTSGWPAHRVPAPDHGSRPQQVIFEHLHARGAPAVPLLSVATPCCAQSTGPAVWPSDRRWLCGRPQPVRSCPHRTSWRCELEPRRVHDRDGCSWWRARQACS